MSITVRLDHQWRNNLTVLHQRTGSWQKAIDKWIEIVEMNTCTEGNIRFFIIIIIRFHSIIFLDDHFPYWIFISIAIVHGNLMCTGWLESDINGCEKNLFGCKFYWQSSWLTVGKSRGEVFHWTFFYFYSNDYRDQCEFYSVIVLINLNCHDLFF